MKLSKHIILSSTLKVETGLRIGGSTEKVEIGGIDNTIIKDPLTGYPYIPGSSLKGKIRTLLEYSCNKVSANGNPWSLKDCGGDNADPIIRIFGNSGAENIKLGPSRIMVRDLKVHKDFLTKPPYDLIEVKTENMINRLSGTALNPRQAERVPAGVTFNMELSYRVFEGFPDGGVSDEELFYKYIPRAFELLEITKELTETLIAGRSLSDIKSVARKSKMLYLQEQALRKVIAGETSVQEVIRVSQKKK